jgi:DNA anti-recombination protein RmuC
MLDNFNIDYLKHIIEDTRKNRNRKNKIHHTQDKLNQQLNQSTKDIEKLQGLFQELDFLKSVSVKLSKNINIYINRMKTATEELNQEKYEKNLNYANKSYNKLKNLVEEENLSKLSKFEELKKSIESKKSLSTKYPSPTRSR